MDKMYILGTSLALVAILAVISVPAINSAIQANSLLTYHSQVCVYKNGEEVGCSHNVLYNTGKNMIRTFLGDTGGDGNEVDVIELCNASSSGSCGTPVAAKSESYTALSGCGMDAASGSYAALAQDGNWSISHVFTSLCDNVLTNATRLGNTSEDFAGNSFSLVTLQTDDQINVTWTIWVT